MADSGGPDPAKSHSPSGTGPGSPCLSRRELECLTALAQGCQDLQIAARLGISRPTVRLHLANARRKLHSITREQALARAVALGLVHV